MARRPVRSAAATKAWVRRRRASQRQQAIPYRLSFCLQKAEPPWKLSIPLSASLRLCAFAPLRYFRGRWVGLVSSRVRVCDVDGWVDLRYLCDLWAVLGGWVDLRQSAISAVSSRTPLPRVDGVVVE